MMRWVWLLVCTAGVAAAIFVPGVRDWLAGQWDLLRAKPGIDQIGFICSVFGLLGVSTLAASWKYLGLTRQIRQKIGQAEATFARKSAERDELKARLAASKAVDTEELMLTAVTAPQQDPGRTRALASLATGLPSAARSLGTLLGPHAKSDAETLIAFADAFEAGGRA